MDNKIFGQRLRQQRKAHGMTIEELAEKIGITQNYLGLVERGEHLPSMATLIKIVNVLGISSDLLLCDEVRNANYLNGEIASRIDENQIIMNLRKYPDIKRITYSPGSK